MMEDENDSTFCWEDWTRVVNKVKIDNKNVYHDLTRAGPEFQSMMFQFFERILNEVSDCVQYPKNLFELLL